LGRRSQLLSRSPPSRLCDHAPASSGGAGVRLCGRRLGLRPGPFLAPRDPQPLVALGRRLARAPGAPDRVPRQEGPRRAADGGDHGGPPPAPDHPGRDGCAGSTAKIVARLCDPCMGARGCGRARLTASLASCRQCCLALLACAGWIIDRLCRWWCPGVVLEARA